MPWISLEEYRAIWVMMKTWSAPFFPGLEISGSLTIIIDSIDTLASDLNSISKAYHLIKLIIEILEQRPSPSSLHLYIEQRSNLLPHLQAMSLSPALTEISVHSPYLLLEAATTFLTPPPPHSSESKFWGVIQPMERRNEGFKLVFGLRGPGCGHTEMALEIVERTTAGSKQSVLRTLEGWADGPAEINDLKSLCELRISEPRSQTMPATAEPSHGLPFNVDLTADQQAARSRVPLPYLHQTAGKHFEDSQNSQLGGQILYDPDSADDLDDEDPDEDLDL